MELRNGRHAHQLHAWYEERRASRGHAERLNWLSRMVVQSKVVCKRWRDLEVDSPFNPLDAGRRYTGFAQTSKRRQKPVYRVCANFPTLPETGIQGLRKLPNGILGLFSNVYWHLNSQVIEIQTRQQQKNNYFHETQRIFMNKFCIWTPSVQRTS